MTAAAPGLAVHGFGPASGWASAVTIPARNEAAHIRACLDAVAAAHEGRGGIVVNVNGCSDATLTLTLDWFAGWDGPGKVIHDPAPPDGSGVGRARRLALDAAAASVVPDGILMTTDADARVAPDWVHANRTALEAADLICGVVAPDPDEWALLPDVVNQRGAVEGEYIHLMLELRRMVGHDCPAKLDAPAPAGASLAFGVALYRDVDMPEVEEREDRMFAARAAACGWRVVHSSLPRVFASCRLDGRTPGGMAGALRSRIEDTDPFCDEALIPSSALLGTGARGAIPARMRLSEVAAELPALRLIVADLARKGSRR